ncbi:MAG: DUF4252 domain-containing protein [Tenacibaculum sp.]
MKQLLLIAFSLFVLQTNAQESNFNEFYKSNKDRAEVSLNVPGFVANFFISDDDVDEFAVFLKKARNYKIMVFDKDVASVKNSFKKFYKRNRLKTLVKFKDGKERVSIYFRESKNRIKEIIVSTHSDKNELVLLGLKTNLTKDELSDLVNATKNNTASD